MAWIPSVNYCALTLANLRCLRKHVRANFASVKSTTRLLHSLPPPIMPLPTPKAVAERAPDGLHNSISWRGKVMLSQLYHHGRPRLLEFHPGMPDADNFPSTLGQNCCASRQSSQHMTSFASIKSRSIPPCEAFPRYHTTSLGVNCASEHIAIINGA
jgi:GntR family transcriptional regulator / MocR family aminotransferase